jgi:hypothetical protein
LAYILREHLAAVLDPTPDGLSELEAWINRMLAAHLPSAVRRVIRRRRV